MFGVGLEFSDDAEFTFLESVFSGGLRFAPVSDELFEGELVRVESKGVKAERGSIAVW